MPTADFMRRWHQDGVTATASGYSYDPVVEDHSNNTQRSWCRQKCAGPIAAADSRGGRHVASAAMLRAVDPGCGSSNRALELMHSLDMYARAPRVQCALGDLWGSFHRQTPVPVVPFLVSLAGALSPNAAKVCHAPDGGLAAVPEAAQLGVPHPPSRLACSALSARPPSHRSVFASRTTSLHGDVRAPRVLINNHSCGLSHGIRGGCTTRDRPTQFLGQITARSACLLSLMHRVN